MLWELDCQEKYYSVQAAVEKKRPLPDWYLNEPILMPGDEFYIKAFFDLSTERQLGMNVGPIPWSNILAYASYSGLEADMIDVFIYTIREMDAAYLNRIAEKQKKAEELKRGNNKHG